MFRTLFKFATGAMLGVALGAAIGVLLAPASGAELKARVNTLRDEVITAGKQAEEERRRELRARFEQAKQSK